MIQSFKDDATHDLFAKRTHRHFANIATTALRKLDQLEAAMQLEDMRAPPGNRLEALHGDRDGQYSIRVNDQFRICFEWQSDGAHNVEITDYH